MTDDAQTDLAANVSLALEAHCNDSVRVERAWIERDGRRTPMCDAGGFGVQFAVPGLDGHRVGIFLMGPVRPAEDRASRVVVTYPSGQGRGW